MSLEWNIYPYRYKSSHPETFFTGIAQGQLSAYRDHMHYANPLIITISGRLRLRFWLPWVGADNYLDGWQSTEIKCQGLKVFSFDPLVVHVGIKESPPTIATAHFYPAWHFKPLFSVVLS